MTDSAMTDSAPYSVPREPGRWRAITLATVVHAALLALLWFGVSWQNETPVAVEAEVWSPQTREAAPRAVAEPEPVAQPKPVVPAPPREIVKPPTPEAPVEDPQIALEQQKKQKQQKQQARREQDREAKQKQAAEQVRQDKLQQAAEQKAEQQREDQQKAHLQAQQQAEAVAKQKAATAEQKKLAADKQRKELLDTQKQNAVREENLARLRRSADTPSAATGTGGNGDAPKSQGSRADASYIDKVRAKIKSNTIFNGADQLAGNPAVEFAVELLPDGSIRRIRKIKASGVPGFDEAVERAIEKSQPYPPDKSGSAPASFTVSYKPKDQ